MSGETVQRHRTDTRRKRGKETVMGLWLYFVLANLRIDCIAFGKVSIAGNEFGRLLPNAFLQVVEIMVSTAVRDNANGQDLVDILAHLHEQERNKPDSLVTFTMTEALQAVLDRLHSHTEEFKKIYPDAKHPVLF